ncbi:hypothetical protein T484DRAFT_3285981 [Baffinella frigidus]|nr:hypothetical protein T484DRAFT_3285981 [Cryptophyta sp. CCMP2293]
MDVANIRASADAERDFMASAFHMSLIPMTLERLEWLHDHGRLSNRLRDDTLQAIAGMSGGHVDMKDWGKLLQCSSQLDIPSTVLSVQLTAQLALHAGNSDACEAAVAELKSLDADHQDDAQSEILEALEALKQKKEQEEEDAKERKMQARNQDNPTEEDEVQIAKTYAELATLSGRKDRWRFAAIIGESMQAGFIDLAIEGWKLGRANVCPATSLELVEDMIGGLCALGTPERAWEVFEGTPCPPMTLPCFEALLRASVNGSAGSHSDRCDDPIARATERIVEWQECAMESLAPARVLPLTFEALLSLPTLPSVSEAILEVYDQVRRLVGNGQNSALSSLGMYDGNVIECAICLKDSDRIEALVGEMRASPRGLPEHAMAALCLAKVYRGDALEAATDLTALRTSGVEVLRSTLETVAAALVMEGEVEAAKALLKPPLQGF